MPRIHFEKALSANEIVAETQIRMLNIARACGQRAAWLQFWDTSGFNIELGEDVISKDPLSAICVHGQYAPAFEAYGLLYDTQRDVWICPPSTGHGGLAYDREVDPSDESVVAVATILAEALDGVVMG